MDRKNAKNKVFNTVEFKMLEKEMFNYAKADFNLNINQLPIIHTKFTERMYECSNKFKENYENMIIENFPFRNYFNFGLFFKLLIMFILFGFGMKGLSFPIYIGFLIAYYW